MDAVMMGMPLKAMVGNQRAITEDMKNCLLQQLNGSNVS